MELRLFGCSPSSRVLRTTGAAVRPQANAGVTAGGLVIGRTGRVPMATPGIGRNRGRPGRRIKARPGAWLAEAGARDD
jgi:hypothetical protein